MARRTDLRLTIKVLVGIDKRAYPMVSGPFDLNDLEVVKEFNIPCILSKAGSLITEQHTWQKPRGKRDRVDRLVLWGSQSSWRNAWWALTELKITPGMGDKHHSWKTGLDRLFGDQVFGSSERDKVIARKDEPWRAVLVLPKEVREHLLALYKEANRLANQDKEKRERKWRRDAYVDPFGDACKKAIDRFNAAKTVDEAATWGVEVFVARQARDKAVAEAWRRWPADISKPAPGDAGPLGELALALVEDE